MAAPTTIAPAPSGFVSPAATVSSSLAAAPPSAVPPVLDDRLPVFTTCEAQVQKVDNRNALVFSVPAGSSVLLKLAAPPSHSYEERDLRWLHLLQALAAVPSRKADTIVELATQALQLLRSPRYKPRLELALRGSFDVLKKNSSALTLSQKALLALRLKDQVARFLREWVKDPVDGFVLRKDHVVGGMRLDDLVATPVGAGYLRGYRREDHCCVVVYPWGHGFIHRSNVEKLAEAIDHERRKRRHNEYLPLEHQHLYEQVESLLDSHALEEEGSNSGSQKPGIPDGIDWERHQQLLSELRDEKVDPDTISKDLSLVRRIMALSNKLHKRQRASLESGDEQEDDSENSDSKPAERGLGDDTSADQSRDRMDVAMTAEEEKAETHRPDHEGLETVSSNILL